MLQTHQEFSDKMGATRRAMSRIDMPGWLQSTIFDYYQVGSVGGPLVRRVSRHSCVGPFPLRPVPARPVPT
jgi:hypothetical protein